MSMGDEANEQAADLAKRLVDASLSAAEELAVMLGKVHERDVDAYHRRMRSKTCDICGCQKPSRRRTTETPGAAA